MPYVQKRSFAQAAMLVFQVDEILQRRKALVENPWKFHAKSQMNTAPLTSVAAERGEKKERNVSSQNAAP